MTVINQIKAYIDSQDEVKRTDLQALHQHILKMFPQGKLWFLDGRDASGKVVSNPNIGYGQYTIRYKDGSTKEFYQIGLSANTSGISIYLMGLEDRQYLTQHFGATIGKATVTVYCIKFKALKDIKLDILEEAMRYAVSQTGKD